MSDEERDLKAGELLAKLGLELKSLGAIATVCVVIYGKQDGADLLDVSSTSHVGSVFPFEVLSYEKIVGLAAEHFRVRH